MTNAAWPLVEFAARLLETPERDAVLGDLLEAGEGAWQGLLQVLGLALRRHAVLWKGWQPWLAGLGALPSSYLLMGVSASVSCTYERLRRPDCFVHEWPTGHEGVVLLLCHVVLLLAWSWSAGFLIGSVSRRTVWASAALCVLPFHMFTFNIEPLPKVCLLLFVLPALLGIWHSLRLTRINPFVALAVATSVTGLMVFAWNSNALWILNWGLLCPPWFLVATARRRAGEEAAVAG